MRKYLLSFVLLSFTGLLPSLAQEVEGVEELTVSYKPELFGAVKAKFETSLYDGAHRFNVRNSRIGVKGNASPNISYFIQIDFSNEGKLAILDSYASYHVKNFEFSLGQQQYRFSTDLDRGPTNNIFANRSFLSKFLMNYHGQELSGGQTRDLVGNIGSRDLGALVRYRLNETPVRFIFGAFNGSGSNNPEWDEKINLVGKVDVGGDHGFGFAFSHYNGHTPVKARYTWNTGNTVPVEEIFTQRIRLWGGEVRYRSELFVVEAEYAQRRLKDNGLHLLQTAYMQGYYLIMTEQSKALKYISPVGRWDMGRNIEFLNKAGFTERFTSQRATLGINLGFTGNIIESEIRLQFEKYFLKDKTSDYSRNPLLQDKVTLEIVATF